MFKKNKLTEFEKFKIECIDKHADRLASDYEFIKDCLLNMIVEYSNLLGSFIEINKDRLEDFIINSKDLYVNEENYFLKQLNFLNNILQLIKLDNNKSEVNYVFLKNNFSKIKDQEEVNIWIEKLEEWQQNFVSVDDKKSYFYKQQLSFNMKRLYEFGNLILVFLTDFDFRRQITLKIMNAKANYENDRFDDIIRQQFIQNKTNNVNWTNLSF